MISQLSGPMNVHMKSILRREYRRLKKESMDWVRLSTGGYRWVTNEVVSMEMHQVKTMYKLLFNEDLINENTV